MKSVPRRRYWPYDEVTATRDCTSSSRFIFTAPWIEAKVEFEESESSRVDSIVSKLSAGSLGPADLPEVTWVFSALSKYPLSYLLPRIEIPATYDSHALEDRRLLGLSPSELLDARAPRAELRAAYAFVSRQLSGSEWKWDVETALAFSAVGPRFDPMTLLTVARRFHLLESVERERTDDVYACVRGYRTDSERFRAAAALVLRQNHYVTEKCDAALRPALVLAKGSESGLSEFMRAEHGHDKILALALRSLGAEPMAVAALDPVVVVMDLFEFAAQRNYLAFSMIVDIFERSTYQKQDPLASLLIEGGHEKAGRQIDRHREINDEGEHENVALEFLAPMAAVDAEYAVEALRLVELVTSAMLLIPLELLQRVQSITATQQV